MIGINSKRIHGQSLFYLEGDGGGDDDGGGYNDDDAGLDIYDCNTLTEILQYVGIFVSTLRTLLSGTKKSQ